MCDAYQSDIDPKKVCKHVPEKKIDTAFVTMVIHGHSANNVTLNLNTITAECYTVSIFIHYVAKV